MESGTIQQLTRVTVSRESSAPPTRSADWRAVCILIALSVISWLPRLKGPIDLRWDGGAYYVLGTSLAEHKGYRLLNEPGNILATQYPPLMALFVAVHQWVLGTSDPNAVGHWLRLSSFLVFTLYMVAIYLMSRHALQPRFAFLVALICFGNLYTQLLSDLLFPEILFAFALTVFVCSCNRSAKRAVGILPGLLAAVAYGLRTIGIAAVMAWAAESLANGRFRQATYRLALALIPVACWMSYIHVVESRQQYRKVAYEYQRADYLYYNVSYGRNISLKDPFRPELGYATPTDLTHRFLANLEKLPSSLGEAVSSKRSLWVLQLASFHRLVGVIILGPWVVRVILIVFGLLVFGGLGLQLRRREWVAPLLTIFSLLGICSTPWPQQFVRYLAPLLPFLALFLLQSVLAIQGRLSRFWGKNGRRTGATFAVAIIGSVLLSEGTALGMTYKRWHQSVRYESACGETLTYRLFFYHDAYRVLDDGLEWLRSQAEPGDIVASSMPHWVYLRTGLKSIMPPFETNPTQGQALLDSVPVRFLILDDGLAVDTRRYSEPVVKTFPGKWRRVYSDSIVAESGETLHNRFAIYERVRPE